MSVQESPVDDLQPWWKSGLMNLVIQGGKFGIVGLLATGVHVGTYVGTVALFGLSPLLANLAGFCIGVIVSYSGHSRWTFRDASAENGNGIGALGKFVIIAISGLLLNTALVYLLTDVLKLHYLYAAIPMVTLVPALTFAFAKYWAFAERKA